MTIRCTAPAKVNLSLRIVGRRADGYHLLDSIFATIALADRLQIRCDDVRRGRATTVRMRCDRPDVPADASNLAARAAIAVLAEAGLGADVSIDLVKRIPPGSGLGGGSSDAAAVLRHLRDRLALTIDPGRLHALALGLGADVPFFLVGGCARVRGIGERIDPIPGWPGLDLVVALPPVAVSTAWAFRAYTGGFAVAAEEAATLAAGRFPDGRLLQNDLEAAVFPAHPVIARTKEALVAAGAGAAVMSGSGSAVVGVVAPPRRADDVAEAVRRRCPDVTVHCTRILGPSVDQPTTCA